MSSRPPIANMSDMEGFLSLLEHARLEEIERVIAGEKWTQLDVEKIGALGNAVASVRDAIAFRKRFDAM